MSLHFSNGQLLLKNTTDNLWYYLSIVLNEEGLPTLTPSETGIAYTGDPYDTYAVLVDSDGNYFKLSLITSGAVTWALDELATPEPPDRIILLGDNGVYYRLILIVADGASRPELVAVDNDALFTSSPFPTLVPAFALGKTVIIVPAL